MSLPPATSYRLPAALPLLALLYLPFIGGGLLTDDFTHIVHLSAIDSTTRLIDGPDAFGFYRPITQSTLAITPGLHGENPAQARAVNVLLHGLVIAMACVVARLLLTSPLAAALATLAFALTPKAPSIAALWISARGELLMAVFSLASIAGWILWTRGGRWWWLTAAIAAYGLALLSKETATLLPLALLLTPRSERSLAMRAEAATGFIVLALMLFIWRSHTGAMMPFAGDNHYRPEISVALWMRNGTNYTGRMVVAPIALLLLCGLVRLLRGAEASASADTRTLKRVRYDDWRNAFTFAAAFVVVFLAPVLPISLRSELYLYLPVFGVCLFAGWLGAFLVGGIASRPMALAVATVILALGGYQVARAREIRHDLRFSENLVTALRQHSAIAGTKERVVLIPSDRATERSLQSTVGGYLSTVLQYAFGVPRAGDVHYNGEPPRQAGLHLTCTYRENDGLVLISSVP
jgi:4-amino-4-deoxy-L-arabinose transferase-like glycosyltransferase